MLLNGRKERKKLIAKEKKKRPGNTYAVIRMPVFARTRGEEGRLARLPERHACANGSVTLGG